MNKNLILATSFGFKLDSNRNPVAWQLKASEGYKLSKPIFAKITDLLYIDNLKVFAALATKMTRVLKATKESTKCMCMHWNENKCAVTHMKKGA